uniref:Putative secreted protein n=1 Tax=Ixodes ricinus TaxID=34613 RepID=A0A6B0TYC6_IXORI
MLLLVGSLRCPSPFLCIFLMFMYRYQHARFVLNLIRSGRGAKNYVHAFAFTTHKNHLGVPRAFLLGNTKEYE